MQENAVAIAFFAMFAGPSLIGGIASIYGMLVECSHARHDAREIDWRMGK